MIGIIVDEYQVLLNRDECNYDLLKSNVKKLVSSFDSLNSAVRKNNDIAFLTNQLESEINQLQTVTANFIEYHNILNKVYTGYNKQAQEIATSLKRIMP